MGTVSEIGEEALVQLVEWEVLGKDELSPKLLLRSLSFADLSVVSRNLHDMAEGGAFITPQMVNLEMMYRTGKIADWRCYREGDHVSLTIQLKAAFDYIPLTLISSEQPS